MNTYTKEQNNICLSPKNNLLRLECLAWFGRGSRNSYRTPAGLHRHRYLNTAGLSPTASSFNLNPDHIRSWKTDTGHLCAAKQKWCHSQQIMGGFSSLLNKLAHPHNGRLPHGLSTRNPDLKRDLQRHCLWSNTECRKRSRHMIFKL